MWCISFVFLYLSVCESEIFAYDQLVFKELTSPYPVSKKSLILKLSKKGLTFYSWPFALLGPNLPYEYFAFESIKRWRKLTHAIRNTVWNQALTQPGKNQCIVNQSERPVLNYYSQQHESTKSSGNVLWEIKDLKSCRYALWFEIMLVKVRKM